MSKLCWLQTSYNSQLSLLGLALYYPKKKIGDREYPPLYRVRWSRSAIRRYPDVNIARQGLYIQWKRQGIICRQPEIMETIHYVEFWKYIPTNNRPQWCILNGGSVRIFVDNHYWYPYLQIMVQYWYSLLSMHCVHLFSRKPWISSSTFNYIHENTTPNIQWIWI